jgi:hypothetical protein
MHASTIGNPKFFGVANTAFDFASIGKIVLATFNFQQFFCIVKKNLKD